MKKERIETDTMGEIKVPSDKYWGAQTQRSLEYFSIGNERMPIEIIRAYGLLKKVAAITNCEFGKLEKKKTDLIVKAAEEVISGELDDNFPLFVWQTGSGTQTNMNVNEVIANRAIEISGGKKGSKTIHPNNDVNMSQSSNDTFSCVMNIAAVIAAKKKLLPALQNLKNSLEKKTKEFKNIIKVGRTHLQDAVPITLGQEFSGYISQLSDIILKIEENQKSLMFIPIGGSAVGTGLNVPKGFDSKFISHLNKITGLKFKVAKNKFSKMAAHDDIANFSGSLRTLAGILMKMANDIRWMGSGPRCGLNELILPSNEPGSSIMPGKVNPTQCEALTMVAVQVYGNDAAIAFAASQGNFELNVFKPVIIYNLLQSINLLSDVSMSAAKNLMDGLKANKQQMKFYLDNSLMLVTALNEVIGYDKAAQVTKLAYEKNISLKEACLFLKFLSEESFDKLVNPKKMVW